jgi:lipopolysaccharide biosynthesis glycosyltransferase
VSLVNLIKHKMVKAKIATSNSSKTEKEGDGVALAFVLNFGFLDAFKVFIYSLISSETFMNTPIVVISDEKKVFEDNVIDAVSDEKIFLNEENIAELSLIPRDRIPDKYKRQDVPKYTFLKWNIFSKSRFSRIIFLDCDMLCLKNANALLSLTGADLTAAPQFQKVLRLDENDRKVGPDQMYHRLAAMLAGEFDENHRRINSGVMILGENLVSGSFKERLIRFAEQNNYINEQSYLTAFFARNKEFSIQLLPSSFNFQENYLGMVGIPHQIDFLSKIYFLHYAGINKPWAKDLTSGLRFSEMLWHRVRALAEEETSLFAV